MRLILTGRCQSEGTAVLYAVSEYADEVLSEILPERALTPAEAKEMLAPVIDTLSYLHAKGLVHGRLKPSNILAVDDRLKLSGDSLQRSGGAVKQPLTQSIYDAPETASGTISPAADLWGLGVKKTRWCPSPFLSPLPASRGDVSAPTPWLDALSAT
jgi:serine/threonine-protein kinase